MNEKVNNNANSYEGNGWSKYQLMVLQQLDDHNKVLQNLNKELVDIKQTIAVSDTEEKMWRTQVMTKLDNVVQEVDDILYDEKGIAQRLNKVERTIDVEEKTTTKLKATWAFYGAILVFTIDIAIKLFDMFVIK